MRITEIVRVDSKGRITIPMVVREMLGIVEGMHMVLLADSEKKEILIVPVLPPKAKLVEIRIEMVDKPGALAEVAERLAKLGVDLIISRCTTVKRGELAECTLIGDISNVVESIESLRQKVALIPIVKYVDIREIKHSVS